MHDLNQPSEGVRQSHAGRDSSLQGSSREVPRGIQDLYCEWEAFAGCDDWADSERGQAVNYILSWYEADPGVFR